LSGAKGEITGSIADKDLEADIIALLHGIQITCDNDVLFAILIEVAGDNLCAVKDWRRAKWAFQSAVAVAKEGVQLFCAGAAGRGVVGLSENDDVGVSVVVEVGDRRAKYLKP
jgi:hypothetical protein